MKEKILGIFRCIVTPSYIWLETNMRVKTSVHSFKNFRPQKSQNFQILFYFNKSVSQSDFKGGEKPGFIKTKSSAVCGKKRSLVLRSRKVKQLTFQFTT